MLALEIYTRNIDFNPKEAYVETEMTQYYGSSLTIFTRAAYDILSPIFNLHPDTVIHYFYFIFFQMGIVALYFLAANFMPERFALFVCVLFGTQPLMFGHAFINPKDTPLLSIFTATVVLGFRAIDGLAQEGQPVGAEPEEQKIKKERRLLVLLLVGVSIVLARDWLQPLSANFVTYAYQAPETNLAHKIFSLFTSTGSLEGYLALVELAVFNLYKWIALLFFLIFLYFAFQVWRHKLFVGWVNISILLAGAVWGVAVSHRVVAVAAGGIVGIYALVTLRQRSVPYLISYTLSAVAISYLSWPYVWFFGIRAWVDSLIIFAEHPWVGNVLFEGQLYSYDALPARYLPKLMLLQFTEAAVILAGIGLVVSIYLLIQKKIPRTKIVLLYAWFALPLSYFILADSLNYNNFRQFIFISPPLFILSGLAMQQITSRLNRKFWHGLLIFFVLLPGLVSLVQLHPYQYIYYNQFTGGVKGAYRQYELDYWLTSYKEIMEYVDENITPGSRVLVWVNHHRLIQYAQNEYKFVTHSEIPDENYTDFEYAVLPTVRFYDLLNLPDQKIIYEVERNGAILAVVKR